MNALALGSRGASEQPLYLFSPTPASLPCPPLLGGWRSLLGGPEGLGERGEKGKEARGGGSPRPGTP